MNEITFSIHLGGNVLFCKWFSVLQYVALWRILSQFDSVNILNECTSKGYSAFLMATIFVHVDLITNSCFIYTDHVYSALNVPTAM